MAGPEARDMYLCVCYFFSMVLGLRLGSSQKRGPPEVKFKYNTASMHIRLRMLLKVKTLKGWNLGDMKCTVDYQRSLKFLFLRDKITLWKYVNIHHSLGRERERREGEGHVKVRERGREGKGKGNGKGKSANGLILRTASLTSLNVKWSSLRFMVVEEVCSWSKALANVLKASSYTLKSSTV